MNAENTNSPKSTSAGNSQTSRDTQAVAGNDRIENRSESSNSTKHPNAEPTEEKVVPSTSAGVKNETKRPKWPKDILNMTSGETNELYIQMMSEVEDYYKERKLKEAKENKDKKLLQRSSSEFSLKSNYSREGCGFCDPLTGRPLDRNPLRSEPKDTEASTSKGHKHAKKSSSHKQEKAKDQGEEPI